MVDLPILQFRNPWHSSFLEKYHLHCFIAFCDSSSDISLDMCIKINFLEKMKTYLFQSHVAHFCTTIHVYNRAHIKAEDIFYKLGIVN